MKDIEINEDRARAYLHALESRALVFDGAMGTFIQGEGLGPEDFGGAEYDGCNDYLSITSPWVIEKIHSAYLEAGADVVETNTFRSNSITLGEYGLGDRVIEINRAAASLARRVADGFSTPEKPRFVAGSIGPSGKLPSSSDPTLGDITYAELVDIFREQAVGLLLGGVDVLLIETSQDILEVKAVMEGIRRAIAETGIKPAVQTQVTLDVSGRMLLGTDISAVLCIIESLGADIIGLNCSTGPDYMSEPVRYLTSHTHLPVSAIPNAGLPKNVDGEAVYDLAPAPMAEMLGGFVRELGCNIIGGCCGTTPEHIGLFVGAVSGVDPWEHRPAEIDEVPRIASAMQAVEMVQEPRPTLVGERVNSQGSRKVKGLLLTDDYDALVGIATDQVDGGAHALDVCVALTERTDEAEQMSRVVKLLSMSIAAPLVFDSTEADVLQAALETYPGRGVVNSINLENGLQRLEEVLPLVRQHGAAVVALTIDEEGMTHTASRKLEVATRIHDIATEEYGLEPHDIIFDVLTFPVTTGQEELRRAAVETIEGIKLVKAALPGVLTILGVSNISFGLKMNARKVINSVFLHHAVEAGLDMAIINPNHVIPYAEIPDEQRELINDLLYDSSEDALPRVIAYYDESTSLDVADSRTDPTEGMSVNEKLHWHILHRKKEGVEDLIDAAVKESEAVWVLNNVLLPAMKDVGDKFGAGELILPFVLQSAEVMKKSVARLEEYLERKEGTSKGTVVLATVFGDVHDIGKNLVGTILGNNGYTIVDLGKRIPVNTIIDAALEHDAVAIGLSALLVNTSKQMPICVQELYKRHIGIPVLVGGAAIHRRFGYRILFMEDGASYDPGVFYCKDAFEGLDVVDRLISGEGGAFVSEVREKARQSLLEPHGAPSGQGTVDEGGTVTSTVSPAPSIPAPEAFGTFVMDRGEIDVHELVGLFDLDTLYRLHWGGRGKKGAEWDELVRDVFEPVLRGFEEELTNTGWLSMGSVYGIFPAASDGDDLLVYDPGDPGKLLVRWTFPRQPSGKRLCLSDYFVPMAVGRDVVGIQAVTSGPEATARMEEYQAAERYTDAYYLNGFANQLAEGLAELTHIKVRRVMGAAAGVGLRYSWGYPACPDLSQQRDVLHILGAERIGVTLTEEDQLVPEQSTAAIVIHHPDAIYYQTGVEKAERERVVREVLGDLKITE